MEMKFWEDIKSGRFASMVKEASKGQSLSNSKEVYHVMKPLFAEKDDVETLHCIFLDGQNNILAIEKMFSGSISSSVIYPREIIKRVLALRATAVIMAHNHPSGNTEPSCEDKSITAKVGIALQSVDVQLHDHIIVGEGFHSMADTGWLKKVGNRFKNLLSHQKE